MSLNTINDNFKLIAPKPLDANTAVGDGMEYVKKEDIPNESRYSGMVVNETLSGVTKTYILGAGLQNNDFTLYVANNDVIQQMIDNVVDPIDLQVTTNTNELANHEARITANEANIATNQSDISGLQQNQITGVEVYSTYADLPATGTVNISYKVSNDPDTTLINPPKSNNAYYHWDGTDYVRDLDIMLDNAVLANDLDANGKKVKNLAKGTLPTDSANVEQLGNVDAIITGKNLFDKSKATDGYITSNGTIHSSSTYCYSDYIPVEVGKDYTGTGTGAYNMRFTCFYDSDYNVVAGGSDTNITTFTIPVGVAFVRVSTYISGKDTFQFEQASAATTYEPFGFLLSPTNMPTSGDNSTIEVVNGIIKVKDLGISTQKIQDKAVTADKTGYIEKAIGKNKFNINGVDVQLGYYVSETDGNTRTSSSYNATGFIPIEPNITYIDSGVGNAHNAFYDINKNFISGFTRTHDISLTTPANAAYIRCSVYLAYWTYFQVEEGNVITPFEAYYEYNKFTGVKINASDVDNLKSGIKDILYLGANEISTPAKQYLIDNYENSIYFEAIMRRWISTHYPRVEDDNWQSLKDVARITNPTTETTGIALKVYDLDFNVIASKTFDMQIGLQSTDNGTVRINHIGDSLSYNSSFFTKVKTLCPNLSFDGMRVPYGEPTIKVEGRGGWTLDRYFTAIKGSGNVDSFTPFMQPIDPYKYYGNTAFWIEVLSGSTEYHIAGFTDKATEIGFDGSTGLLTAPAVNDVMYNDSNAQYEYWDGSAWTSITETTLGFTFNYAKYRAVWNISQADIVSIMLGTNDFRGKNNETDIDAMWNTWKTRIETIVTSVRNDNANAKVALFIAPSVNGRQDNDNNLIFVAKTNAMMWYARKLLIRDFDVRETDGIYVVDTGSSLDPNYGFTENYELPFSDYTGTERRIINSNEPHPQIDGYYQMGVRIAGFIQKTR